MMQPEHVKTAADARTIVEESAHDYVKVGVFDIDGVLRGKFMHKDKFFSALEKGFGLCDVVLGWDSADQLYDSAEYTGWHTAYPDAPVRIVPESCRRIPFEDDMLLFLGEFHQQAEEICSRGVLRRVLGRASDMGFNVAAAAEFEFFMFDETPHSVREKGFRNLKTISPGSFGYSMLRNSVFAEFHHELLQLCSDMRFPLEALHTETGPGVLEAAIQHTDALSAADGASLFKTYTKILAERRGWMVTFMAKWSTEWPGQSGHLHISLTGADGRSVFHNGDNEHAMSDQMRWFIGGQQALMPEFLSMVAPTVNSFRRLIPGSWAPTAASWGFDNRTCALRAITGSAKEQRVEYRVAAADINPHIALAAAIGSGLWGIEHQLEPTDAIDGSAYDRNFPAKLSFPATLHEAAGRLRKSKAASQLFGDGFVRHYAQSREWEEREFRKAVTDWEMERYFEII